MIKTWSGIGDPILSQSPREFYAFHFLAQILVDACILCQYGNISVSCYFEFFTLALNNGFSLKYEWQQVSSYPQNSIFKPILMMLWWWWSRFFLDFFCFVLFCFFCLFVCFCFRCFVFLLLFFFFWLFGFVLFWSTSSSNCLLPIFSSPMII